MKNLLGGCYRPFHTRCLVELLDVVIYNDVEEEMVCVMHLNLSGKLGRKKES